ncbi:hypothetical protein CIL05_06805 [Virgibacillus profundi]|uniref:Uncharacterized protein n=1 Tax=Virgibacillus profundi TaxID=2024555 RepID=A0A2A2IDU3_9BACI|nr:hypothetical protein [Virgibacillus profundi]PAV30171.1 hypothetical protein CIL05_06805 [Virgibacillus profundi]PXY54343.1 hypothetical protein CIT14_06890 [Virgibacillus profundi]
MNTTSYNEIYEKFLSKIQDYDLLNEIQTDLTFAKEMLLDYLKSAHPHFTYASIKFEDVMDDTNEQFTISLSSTEKEILARFMVVEYMSPKLLRTEMFEQKLGSKDFQIFSPGNLLGQLKELRALEEERTNTLMLQYYYMEGM